MQLLFKQRLFSWFDSYDVYDQNGNTVYVVQGKLSWGHRLEIYDTAGNNLGTVKEEVLTFLPRFKLLQNGVPVGEIRKELSFFKPVFTLDHCGWRVEGDVFGWNYDVRDASGAPIMQASKQLLNFTDTYVLDIPNPQNALQCLMIVLAIDAAKDTASSNN